MNSIHRRIGWSTISLVNAVMFSSCMMRGNGATDSHSLTAEIARGPSKNFVHDLDFELFDSSPNVFWSFDHQKGNCPSSFHQQVEKQDRTLGSSSLRFAFDGQPCQAASSAAMASLPEWVFAGQKLRVSVDLKRDAGLFGGVQLAIRCSDHCAGGVQDQYGAYSLTANSLEATDWNSVNWQKVSFDVLAPKGALTVDLHLLVGFLPEDGQLPPAVGTHHSVLFDNVVLEFVDLDDKVAGSSTASELNPSEYDLQNLRKSVLPDVTAAPQIKSVAAKLAEASVVGLGEATHGTREFQNYKVALIKELITSHGFRVVAFEESLAVAGIIEEKLNSASGADLLKLFYITWWKTDHVAELFDWIRGYNAQHPTDPVHFAGFDQFDPASAVANIKSYLEGNQSPGHDDIIACLDRSLSKIRQKDFVSARLEAESAKSKLTAAKPSASEAIHHWEWALQNNIMILQNIAFSSLGYGARDKAMADNAIWTKKHWNDKKTILWAHNAHVSKQSPNMGSHLIEAFSGEYTTLGFAFNRGSFSAKNSQGAVDTTNVPASPSASLGGVLTRLGQGSLYMSGVAFDKSPWISGRRTWSGGSMVGVAPIYIGLPAQFDHVVYFEKSTPISVRQ